MHRLYLRSGIAQRAGSPDQAREVIADNKAEGIETEIAYVEYLPDEINTMAGKMSQALRRAGYDVWEIAPADGYSSLEIKGTDLASADQERVSELARQTVGDLPVKVVPFDPVEDGNPIVF